MSQMLEWSSLRFCDLIFKFISVFDGP